jgi:hypothetical protein
MSIDSDTSSRPTNSMDVIKEEHEFDEELYSECTIKNEECVIPDTFPVVRTRAMVSNMHYAVLMREK